MSVKSVTSKERIITAINTAFSSKYTDPEKYHEYVLSRGRGILARDVAAISKRAVGDTKQPTALDLGAGTGIISAALQKEGFVVTATDGDNAMVKSLKAKLTNVVASQLDFNRPFDLKDNSFDVVTTVWANRYLTKSGTANFIHEVHRVLKPEGTLVWPLFTADHAFWRIRAGIAHHTTPSAIAKRLKAAGFTDITVDRQYKQKNHTTKELPNWVYPVYILARKDK